MAAVVVDESGRELTREEFKKLRLRWYKKLEKAGFVDIEYPAFEGSRYENRIWRSTRDLNEKLGFYDRGDPDIAQYAAVRKYRRSLEYYASARALVFTYQFKSRKDKRIWELHSDGKSYRQIARLVRGASRNTVSACIAKLQKALVENNRNSERDARDDSGDSRTTGYEYAGGSATQAEEVFA